MVMMVIEVMSVMIVIVVAVIISVRISPMAPVIVGWNTLAQQCFLQT